ERPHRQPLGDHAQCTAEDTDWTSTSLSDRTGTNYVSTGRITHSNPTRRQYDRNKPHQLTSHRTGGRRDHVHLWYLVADEGLAVWLGLACRGSLGISGNDSRCVCHPWCLSPACRA